MAQLQPQLQNQLQPQLQNQPPTHLALRSAAQTTTVRMEHAKTETAFPTPLPQTQAQLLMLMVVAQLMVVTQLQPLQPASLHAARMTTAKKVLSARTVSARSLARMMPTAMVPTKSVIPPMTTASTALQTISVKMVALVTLIAGQTCLAAVPPTAARRSATPP